MGVWKFTVQTIAMSQTFLCSCKFNAL